MANTPSDYVSLGDSMSIDDYSGMKGGGAASLLFANQSVDFPEWNGRDLQTVLAPCRFLPLALDGATSAAVRYAQIPRLKEWAVRPAVVTLTMGGNDLLQTFGDSHAADAANRALREHGRAILTDLQKMVLPGAPIVLTTIYDPSDGTGDTGALQILPWPGALAWIHAFNETLRSLSREFDTLLGDAHATFQGHGLLAGNPAQTEPRPANRDLFYCGVIEPNAWGASALRGLWWETLQTAGHLPAGEPTDADAA